MTRERLPDRRLNDTAEVEFRGVRYAVTIGYYPDAKRMLEVTVPLADLRPLGADKAKAQTVHVVREVTLDGSPLHGVVATGEPVTR